MFSGLISTFKVILTHFSATVFENLNKVSSILIIILYFRDHGHFDITYIEYAYFKYIEFKILGLNPILCKFDPFSALRNLQ